MEILFNFLSESDEGVAVVVISDCSFSAGGRLEVWPFCIHSRLPHSPVSPATTGGHN